MQLILDNLLGESVERACEGARLGRTGDFLDRAVLLIEILYEFEAGGDAMRYLDSDGQIAWKATPQLRDYLMDLQLDAETDVEDF
jgi:hypothetical protein